MKKARTLNKLLSLLCCLAMLMAWLPVLPAAAAEPVMSEDFESTSVGSFPSTFSKSNLPNGGTANETVQSSGGNKYLELVAQNGDGASSGARARIKTKEKWSKSYTVEWDMNNLGDKWSIFEVYIRTGGYVRARVNSAGQMAFYVHEAAKVAGEMAGQTSDITLSTKTWYTMRVQVTDEIVTYSARERDTGKVLGEMSLVQSTATYADLLMPYEFWFSLSGHSTVSNTAKMTVAIDNVRIYDGVDNIPAAPSKPTAPTTPSTPTVSLSQGRTEQAIAEGKERWVILQDNFESYIVGEDTFYGANANDYAYTSSYHGTKSDDADASYSLYSIVNDGGSKALELTSINATRNWLVTRVGVSGSYSVQMNFKFPEKTGSTTPNLILNPFQGYSFPDGKTMLTYVYPDYVQLIDNVTTGSNVSYYVNDASGSRMKLGYDQWYTIKITVAEGQYGIKVWPKGETEPTSGGGVMTLNASAINADVLAYANNVRIQNRHRSKPGEAYVVMVDDLQMYKTFDSMTVPATLFGVPGEELSVAPAITGQNLTAEKPALSWVYKLVNPNLGTVNKKGELVLGPGEGQTRLTLTLADRNGDPVGASATATLVVGTSNGVTAAPSTIKVGEGDVGKTAKLTATVSDTVKSRSSRFLSHSLFGKSR